MNEIRACIQPTVISFQFSKSICGHERSLGFYMTTTAQIHTSLIWASTWVPSKTNLDQNPRNFFDASIDHWQAHQSDCNEILKSQHRWWCKFIPSRFDTTITTPVHQRCVDVHLRARKKLHRECSLFFWYLLYRMDGDFSVSRDDFSQLFLKMPWTFNIFYN